MMSGITTEIQSAGGGGYGYGNGGYGNNPLLWLITLGFLRGSGLGGDSNGATQEGIACLQQGQAQLSSQQQFDRIAANMEATGNRTVSAVGDLSTDFNSFSRDLNMTLCNGFNDSQIRSLQGQFDLSRQLADCCCDTRAGLKEVETAICSQTNTLLTSGNNNTQRILDTINGNKIQELQTELGDAKTRIALAEQTTALITACGCCPSGNSAMNAG